MNNKKEIKLEFKNYNEDNENYCRYCIFNLKGEFILYTTTKMIWIYSTTKNSKWKCKKVYEIPEDVKFISLSKYDKLFLYSNNYICEWNIPTEKSTRIIYNEDYNYKVSNILKLFVIKSIL